MRYTLNKLSIPVKILKSLWETFNTIWLSDWSQRSTLNWSANTLSGFNKLELIIWVINSVGCNLSDSEGSSLRNVLIIVVFSILFSSRKDSTRKIWNGRSEERVCGLLFSAQVLDVEVFINLYLLSWCWISTAEVPAMRASPIAILLNMATFYYVL